MKDYIFTFNEELAEILIAKGFVVKNISAPGHGMGFENSHSLRKEIIEYENNKRKELM